MVISGKDDEKCQCNLWSDWLYRDVNTGEGECVEGKDNGDPERCPKMEGYEDCWEC